MNPQLIWVSIGMERVHIKCPILAKLAHKKRLCRFLFNRISQGVGSLFRRIRLPYQGSESSGKIRISGLAVKKWLQPKLVSSSSVNSAQTQLGLSQLRLAKEITRQQRKIRSGNLSLD